MVDEDLEEQIRGYAEGIRTGDPVTPEQARARARAVWSRHRRRRRWMVAAAVVVLLAATGLFVRTSLAVDRVTDDTVTAGRPIPRDLWELADRVAALPPTTVLGESDDARYTYRRATRSTDRPTSEVTSDVEEMWVSADGSGRQVTTPGDNPNQTSEGAAGPDLFTVDGVPVRTFLQLPDDVGAVAAAFANGKHGFTIELAPLLVDALSYTGLPGPARAGALRALEDLGMVPVPDDDPGPHLLRVTGPRGPDGWKLQADFDVRTGMVVAWDLLGPDGEVTRIVTIEVDLRRDSRRRP